MALLLFWGVPSCYTRSKYGFSRAEAARRDAISRKQKIALAPFPDQSRLPVASTDGAMSAAKQNDLPARIPQRLKAMFNVRSHPQELDYLFADISNHCDSVEQMLREKQYETHTVSGNTWVKKMDKDTLTDWTVNLNNPGGGVSSVRARVYTDDKMTESDKARSFSLSFFSDGNVSKFWRDDKSDTLIFHTNSTCSVEYSRKIGDEVFLEMRWDGSGNLISSNVYNWALRGRVIGGSPPPGKTAYRFGPTSSVEAATESWLRKGE